MPLWMIFVGLGFVLLLYSYNYYDMTRLVEQNTVRPLDPAWLICEDLEDVHEKAREFFALHEPVLEACGFEAAGCLRTDPDAEQQHVFALMFIHTQNDDIARIYCCVDPIAMTHVEFHTEYDDGSVLGTANGKFMTKKVLYRSSKRQFWFPKTEDAGQLYRNHQQLASHHCRGKSSVPPIKDTMLQMVKTDGSLDYQSGIERGVFLLNQEEQTIQMTMKGAFLLTCTLLWPTASVLKTQRRLHDRRALRQAQGR